MSESSSHARSTSQSVEVTIDMGESPSDSDCLDTPLSKCIVSGSSVNQNKRRLTNAEKQNSRSTTPEATCIDAEAAATETLTNPQFESLCRDAKENAPRCDGVPLQWMTIAQAARTLGIHKSVIANWATRGYIATVKGMSNNAHRLVHLDNILIFMQESILQGINK